MKSMDEMISEMRESVISLQNQKEITRKQFQDQKEEIQSRINEINRTLSLNKAIVDMNISLKHQWLIKKRSMLCPNNEWKFEGMLFARNNILHADRNSSIAVDQKK
ncbi:hypothetical protein ACOME3_009271 [Neoechinorhynchus agilis]